MVHVKKIFSKERILITLVSPIQDNHPFLLKSTDEGVKLHLQNLFSLVIYYQLEASQRLPLDFSARLMVKNRPTNAGDANWIPGSKIFPGGESGNPLQYSYLGKSLDRGAWQSMGLQKSWTRLSS